MKRPSLFRLSAALALTFGLALSAGPVAGETLVIAATVTPGGFDPDALRPNTQNVVAQIYDTLVVYPRERQPDGTDRLDFTRVVPRLAESWEPAADGKSYLFKLKRGVKSPFGNEMTADDVVWSWDKSIAQGRAGRSLAIAAAITGVEKVSTYEVRFNLRIQNQIFLRALAHYTPAIYDTTEMKRNATAADPWALKFLEANTAGFGPYHLQSVRQGEQAVFIANPNYHGGKPFYDRVVYREVPSPGNRMQLLRAGQVQWIEELTHLQFQELRNDPRIKVVASPGTSMASARMNAKFKPFDDLRVRQAIAYATDYEAVRRVVFLGAGSRPRSLIPPMIPGSDPSFYPFETDYAKARELLREAGHPNGIDIAIEYSTLEWWEEGVAIALQQSFAQAGIRLTPKRITAADMRARSAPGVRDLPFFTFRDYPVVLDPAYKLFIDAHPDGPSDRNAYDNPRFIALVNEALVAFDETTRNALLREAQRLHAEDVSWVYIMYPGHFEAMPACMQGYAWFPDYHERWSNLRCVR
jgi:peptide/nickel transport system substrate-binding protein